MNNSDLQNDGEIQNLKEIPKWTRRYAQNRPIAFLIFMAVFVVLSATIGAASYLGGYAYRAGNWPLFWIAVAGLSGGLGFCFWFSNPYWGGRWMERNAKRFYEDEGEVYLEVPKKEETSPWLTLAVELLVLFVIVGMVLGFVGLIPIESMQPVSALFVVPFLVFVSIQMRPIAGWIPFLWPALYALHAILMVMGAPIRFERPWEFLNMLIPVAGYGLLSGLIAHFFGRFSLGKLKNIVGAKE